MSDCDDCDDKKYFGKYAGTVVLINDPLNIGRIQATVPSISTIPLNFAKPCVPYAGPGVGFLAIPPIGAHVWIEFQAGQLDFPIWAGCYWETAAEMPTYPGTFAIPQTTLPPNTAIFKTSNATVFLGSTGVSLHAHTPAQTVLPVVPPIPSPAPITSIFADGPQGAVITPLTHAPTAPGTPPPAAHSPSITVSSTTGVQCTASPTSTILIDSAGITGTGTSVNFNDGAISSP